MFKQLRKLQGINESVNIEFKRRDSITHNNEKFTGMTTKLDNGYLIEYVADDEMLKTLVHELAHVQQFELNQELCCEDAERAAIKFITRGR